MLEAVPFAASMDKAAPPRVPLVGIRSRKPAGPDPLAAPEIGVVVLTAEAISTIIDRGMPGTAAHGESVGGVIGALEEAGYPFEVLIARGGDAGLDASSPRGDPRVRVVRTDRPGMGGALRDAADASRADFILPLFPPAAITPDQVQALRNAMDSWSAYSYLPGEPAADVALIARPSSALRSATMYALFGLYAGDPGGPIMIRRSRLLTLHATSDPPATLVEIAARVKRDGGVVRIVTTDVTPGMTGTTPGILTTAAAHPPLSLRSAIRLRASIRKAGSR